MNNRRFIPAALLMIKFAVRYLGFVAGILQLLELAHSPAGAATIYLNPAAIATAEDVGPQDGVFDDFTPGNLGSVDNNGFTSFRTALEFNVSSVPVGSHIISANLVMWGGYVEGTRNLALHGYAGDGSIQLADFSRDGFVDSTILSPDSSYVVFDVTKFIQGVTGRGGTFGGFNLREDPANRSNFEVLFFETDGVVAPRLSIVFEPPPVFPAPRLPTISSLAHWQKIWFEWSIGALHVPVDSNGNAVIQGIVLMPVPATPGDGTPGKLRVRLKRGQPFLLPLFLLSGNSYRDGSPGDRFLPTVRLGFRRPDLKLTVDGVTFVDSRNATRFYSQSLFIPPIPITESDSPLSAYLWLQGVSLLHAPLSVGKHTIRLDETITIPEFAYTAEYHNTWSVTVK